MTTIPSSSEIPTPDVANVSPQEHRPDQYQYRFDVDDAFSVHDDDTTEFGFGDSFLKQLQLPPSVGAEESELEIGEKQHSRQTDYNATDISAPPLDLDTPLELHHAPSSPPRPPSSSHSFNSEEQPPTPSDDSSPSPTYVPPPFIDVSLSTPLDPSMHANHNSEQHLYPNVVIDVSKAHMARMPDFTSSSSQGTMDTQDSSSSTSEHVIDPADSFCKNDGMYPLTQPVDTTSSSLSPGHRSSGSVSLSAVSKPSVRNSGPSTFQKVVSITRPPHLPPKKKDEDEKHHKEWEEMMERSRVAEQNRRDALEARRLARELSVEANISLWQRAVIPEWKKAITDRQLRKLWWDGVPTKLRSIVWERAVGNALALSKNSYSSTLARANNLLASQRFPRVALDQIEADISRTLPQLHIFRRDTGPLYSDLHDLLCAWMVSRADEGMGYVEGVAKIGGMLILNLTGPAQAFVVMRNLLEIGCLRAFYGGSRAQDDVEAYYRIFDTLLADGMPKVYFNFKQHQISPSAYLPDWLMPLFLDHLPLEGCLRIWDVLLLEGDAFLFRAALAMLGCLESRLFFPDRTELLAVLKGRSPAALQVARRTSSRSPNQFEAGVGGPLYDIYGLNEETVWERVVGMSDWWKESTWQRLIQRELPDL